MANPQLELTTPIQYVRGVGPYRARAFESLGVRTVGDLLEYAPFRYERIPPSVPIDQLRLDETATVVGAIESVRRRGRARNAGVTADVVDGTGRCHVRWFNAPYVADRLQRGQIIRMTGKVDVFRDEAQFVNPRLDIRDTTDEAFAMDEESFVAVYPANAQLNSPAIARILSSILPQALESIAESLPAEWRERRSLPPRRTAIARLHQPLTADDADIARQRLAYDELLLLQLAVRMVRGHRVHHERAIPIKMNERIDERIRARLPFELTAGQNRAVADIVRDLAKPRPMNRLLQGDVGSGKTAVAVYAALATTANQRQSAILAPTEVLAEQHHRKFERYLKGSRVRLAFLAGGTPKSRRDDVLRAARQGNIDILVGTHALIEKDVAFRDLGLLIVDEQHKFGVAQRAAARGKGDAVHSLVMTATPIPRTLAMTCFGDLDISTIRDAPPGRHPVTTHLAAEKSLDEVWRFVRERVGAGEQAYVVYPLIDESEALPLKSSAQEFERLTQGPLAGISVGLVHGRMRREERDGVMTSFRAGDIAVLVSTTVIEVGVDVPQATVMVIEHAERFGLSQLHQLRGRVGRGSKASHCFLVYQNREGTAAERLRVLAESSDGFRVAEEDLRLRGPGEWLGKRQHGVPEFKFADVLSDLDLLQAARDDAAELLASDADLSRAPHRALREALHLRYGKAMPWVKVG